jgi:hypothetical protein
MDPTDRPLNESHDGTFDPGVLEIESFLTEEQEARLLAEYGDLINEELFEGESVDELL